MRSAPKLNPLAPLGPLADLMLALARRRALSRGLRWAIPLGALTLVLSVLLARYAPQVPRALGMVCLLPALWPLLCAARALRDHPLELCLAIDQHLDAEACVLSAAEIALSARVFPLGPRVTDDARKALKGRRARDVIPPWSVTEHRAMALVATSVLLAVAVPVPARVLPRAARIARVQSPEAAAEARRVAEALELAALHDPERASSLRAAAESARSLGLNLELGSSRDEALTELDAIDRQAEQALGWARDQQHRAAVDAALSELNDPATRGLRDALARGDMRALDAAARALADTRESAARQSAQESLGRAAEAARRAGATDLARALDDEASLLRRRGQSSALARAVSEALGRSEGSRRIAEHLARGGDGAAGDGQTSRALDDVMREIDRGLTPEERRRLAEALARLATQGADPGSRAALEGAARAATPEELRAAMQEILRQLRDGSLDRTHAGAAGQAAGEAAGGIGRVRLGMQRTSSGNGGRRSSGTGPPGGAGGSHDEGHTDSSGHTRALGRRGFVAPARGMSDPAHPGVPLGTDTVDSTGARAQGPMEVQLRQAAPSAVRGVEHTPMPQPYRDQVRVYFNP